MRPPETVADLADLDRKLPPPRDDVPLPHLRDTDCALLPAGTAVARIFSRGGEHPVAWNAFRHFGPTAARFDHHLPDAGGRPQVGDRGILYLAVKGRQDALTTCLAEVFQATALVDLRRNDPWFVIFETARPVRLLDLHGLWPTRAGASSAIASGPRARARLWSRRIHAEYTGIEGLAYPSSMAGLSEAFAFYERAATAIPAVPLLHRSLSDPVLRKPILRACDALDWGIVGL